ncbi:hypothetical protein RYX36_031795 [Vicia faba]
MANFITSGSGGPRESLVERQAKINAACSSFIQIGFRPELFSLNNLHNHGYTDTKFLELIQPISFIPDLCALRSFFNIARESVYYPSATPPNGFFNFVNCINWMKSELSAKMQKEGMTVVALARILFDYATPLTQVRKRIQSEIDELKKRQMELEAQSARISADLKLKLGPLYGYEEPSIAEMRVGSYLLYVKDCISRGITATPKFDEMACANLVDVFGGAMKERHLIKFLNDPVRKKRIETYFNSIRFKGLAAMDGNGY